MARTDASWWRTIFRRNHAGLARDTDKGLQQEPNGRCQRKRELHTAQYAPNEGPSKDQHNNTKTLHPMSFRRNQPWDENKPIYEIRCRQCQIFMHVEIRLYRDVRAQVISEGWGKRNEAWACPNCMRLPVDSLKDFRRMSRSRRHSTGIATSNAISGTHGKGPGSTCQG